jgi:hypothetical protein
MALSCYYPTFEYLLFPFMKKKEGGMKPISLILLLIIFIIGSGCSVYMAAHQPEKKDLNVFEKGTPRSEVVAECGSPVFTKESEGKKVDVFTFTQGYSEGSKTGRALFHGTADVLTLGLWEVVGTPIESVADGTEVQVEVCYDADDNVDFIKVLKGEKCFKEGESVTPPTEGNE